MASQETDPYAACEMTPEEEKKVKSSLGRFRKEAAPVFERFRAGSIVAAEMQEIVKRLDARASEELESILGETRCHTFIEHIVKHATPKLAD
jgi:hypothetical protein